MGNLKLMAGKDALRIYSSFELWRKSVRRTESAPPPAYRGAYKAIIIDNGPDDQRSLPARYPKWHTPLTVELLNGSPLSMLRLMHRPKPCLLPIVYFRPFSLFPSHLGICPVLPHSIIFLFRCSSLLILNGGEWE